MLHVDGSLGEGGGQIVRLALALSALTSQPVKISDIRQHRRAPGLRPDLIATANAMAEITRGRCLGADVGAREMEFHPGAAVPGRYEFTIPHDGSRRGSVTHLIQTAMPALLWAGGNSEVTINGATHAPASPTATYLQTVFCQTLRKFGIRCEVATEAWGFGDGKPGRVRLRVEALRAQLQGMNLSERGQLLQIGGTSVANGLTDNYAERQKNWATRRVGELGSAAQVTVQSAPGTSTGAMLFFLVVFEFAYAGFTALASEGVAAEQVADNAIRDLREYLVSYRVQDKHLADQLLIYAALADGMTILSTSELTEHTKSAAAIIEQFLQARVTFDGPVGGPCEIEIAGAAFG